MQTYIRNSKSESVLRIPLETRNADVIRMGFGGPSKDDPFCAGKSPCADATGLHHGYTAGIGKADLGTTVRERSSIMASTFLHALYAICLLRSTSHDLVTRTMHFGAERLYCFFPFFSFHLAWVTMLSILAHNLIVSIISYWSLTSSERDGYINSISSA